MWLIEGLCSIQYHGLLHQVAEVKGVSPHFIRSVLTHAIASLSQAFPFETTEERAARFPMPMAERR